MAPGFGPIGGLAIGEASAPSCGGASQSLAPSLFTDSDSFSTPQLNLIIYPSLFTDSDTLTTPTVAAGAVNLAPSLFTDTETLYTGTVTAGAVNLSPTLCT